MSLRLPGSLTVIDKQFETNMPQAVTFHYLGKPYTVYFSQPRAMLPVKFAREQTRVVSWGRRLNENSEMPLGGWAMLPAIYKGRWNQYSPKPVRLLVEKFMVMDYENHPHWYEVVSGQWIQGLLAHYEQEYRVYIVTFIPERLDLYFHYWPRIMFNLKSGQ